MTASRPRADSEDDKTRTALAAAAQDRCTARTSGGGLPATAGSAILTTRRPRLAGPSG